MIKDVKGPWSLNRNGSMRCVCQNREADVTWQLSLVVASRKALRTDTHVQSYACGQRATYYTVVAY